MVRAVSPRDEALLIIRDHFLEAAVKGARYGRGNDAIVSIGDGDGSRG